MSDDRQAVGSLLLRLGRLALESGADSEHTRELVTRAAYALNVDAQLFIGSDRLLVMTDQSPEARTRVGHAIGSLGVNASRLAALDDLARQLMHDSIGLEAARRRLDEIDGQGALYPHWLVILGVAATAASLARLFGAAWPVVAAAFVAGIVSTGLRLAFSARGFNPTAATFLTALASAATGVLSLRFWPSAPAALCLTAAGMILVPGVPLINGIADLVRGHPAMGVARLAGSIAVVLAIGSGLFLATLLTGTHLPVLEGPGSVGFCEDAIFSGVAAVGYALLFNAPLRAIGLCVVAGVCSHAGRTLIDSLGMDVSAATCACALVAGLLACLFARLTRLPWTVFAFPGVVAMIPGSYAFRAAIGLLLIMRSGPASPPALVAGTISAGVAAIVMTVGVGVGLLVAFAIAHRRGGAGIGARHG
jgi:uncharacterized membrane protein YjjP (DUF1212 family)